MVEQPLGRLNSRAIDHILQQDSEWCRSSHRDRRVPRPAESLLSERWVQRMPSCLTKQYSLDRSRLIYFEQSLQARGQSR